jgi:hypothetical protein
MKNKGHVELQVAALPAASGIPSVPKGFTALSGPERQALLKIPAEQRAEVDQALEELWEKKAQLAKDLAHLAPDAERGNALFGWMKQAREVNAQVKLLGDYTDDQEALANDGVMRHINDAAEEIEHAARKNPALTTRYAKVLRVVEQRRQAVSDGIARSKAQKAGDPKPEG